MLNIYLIITLITSLIINIIVVLYLFKNNKILKNKKLTEKNYTKSKMFSTNSIIRDNHKYKILIVEDDFANRKILKAQLTSAKYNVETVADGFSALKLLKKDNSISVVLLDLILPDISGFEVCKIIRQDHSIFQLPVIMVTAKNRIEDLIDGFNSGANDFINKPYNIYELITRINSSISLKKMYEDNTSLKKLNKLKSDIVDMAAHDMKSPLTIISGYSKRILKHCSENDIAYENAEKILNSSNKMLSIIDNLLNDSKYQTQNLNFENINLQKIISDSIEFYKDMATSKKQNLNFINSKETFINADKSSISTIIDNLLSNAIKYSPINGTIDIKLENSNNESIISIKDDGNGFTEDEIENMFKKFFPYTNKPTRGESSSGVGLYIVNEMVTKNRGKIKVNSERGKGSEFIINFPKN